MLKIESISVNANNALSMWFSKNHTYEYMCFGNIDDVITSFGNTQATENDIERNKRSFGSLILDGLQIADSDEYGELKEYCMELQSILKIGKGKSEYSAVGTELFRTL